MDSGTFMRRRAKWLPVLVAFVVGIACLLAAPASAAAPAGPAGAASLQGASSRSGSVPAPTGTVVTYPQHAAGTGSAAGTAKASARTQTTLGSSIASIAESQVGVTESPQNTNCNPYTGFWGDGTPTGLRGATCHSGYRATAWCADFAAWVWRKAGVSFTYGSTGSNINAWAASFYKWGVANKTWHPLSSSYTPQPGDAAVYGNLTEAPGPGHVAIVTGGTEARPNVVNGNWAMNAAWTLWGVVAVNGETSDGESGGGLQGYVSPGGGSSASAPAAPSSVSASPLGQGEATVSWQPGPNGGSAVSYYTVTSNPPAVSLSYDPGYTSVVLAGLTTGVSYTFTVTATNAVGTSPSSAPSNPATPYTYPDPPTLTNVVSGDGQATVYFGPPANDGYTPITSYLVTAGTYDVSTGTTLEQTATGAGSPLTLTGLIDGDSYWVYVQAFNAGGNSASSNDGTATPAATGKPAGDVFVADPAGNRVVEVATDGSEKTIGSGFKAPHDVAVDAAGDVFVADTADNRVVEVAADGTQTTIGSGFNSPDGVAVDGSGNVYVADTGNNRVVEIGNPSRTQTVIGSGFSGPEAVVVDASGNLWVADTSNSRVVEFPAAGGSPITRLTGVTGDQYLAVTWNGGPTPSATGIGLDPLGDNYYPDAPSGRLLMQSAGSLTSLATGLGGAAGMAVWSPPPVPGWVGTTTGDASVTVSFDPPDAMVGYSPVTGYEISCKDLTTPANGTTVVSATSSPVTVGGLVNGDNYSCEVAAENVVGVGAAAPTKVITPAAPGTPSSNVFFADYYADQLLEVPANSGVPSVTLATGLDGPEYVAVDPHGNAYVANVPAHEVLRFPAGGGSPAVVANGVYGIFGVSLDGAGNVYVGGSFSAGGGTGTPDYVTEYPASGGSPRTVATDSDAPQAMTVDATGDVFIADTGAIIEQPASGGSPVKLASALAAGVAVDSHGNVYYTDTLNSQVIKIAAGTGTTSTVGSGLSYPEGVAVDGAGNVYISDTFNNRVIEVPANGASQFTVETAVDMPAGLTVQAPAVPGVPGGVSLSTSNAADTATLAWSAPASAGASAISGYVVSETGASGTAVAAPVQVPAGTRSYTFQNVPTGQPITFSVEAVNIDGTSGGASASGTLTALPVQTISFTAPATGTVGGSATLTATGGGSGNPVTFSMDPASTAGACALSGPNGSDVRYQGTGSCLIDANQAGSSSYQSAAQVQRIITVDPASQRVTVSAPSSGTFGGTAALSGTGGASGNPVVFTVDSSSWPGVCSVSGTNGTTLTYTGAGTCVIDANQAGSANYTAAPQVQRLITVSPASQRITFTAPAAGTVGGSVPLTAKGGPSGMPVRFSVDKATKAGICSVSGTNGGTLRYSRAGTCLIDANQASNANSSGLPTYAAAPQVQRAIKVGRAATKTALSLSAAKANYGHEQSEKLAVTVSFTGIAPAPAGTVTVKAGGATVCVITLSAARGSCTLTASELKAGSYHLVASYGGSANFGASISPGRALTISKG